MLVVVLTPNLIFLLFGKKMKHLEILFIKRNKFKKYKNLEVHETKI